MRRLTALHIVYTYEDMNNTTNAATEDVKSLLQSELDEWRKVGIFEAHSVTQSADGPEWFNALVFQDGEEFGIEFEFELEGGTLDMSGFEFELEGGSSFASESEHERRAVQGQA